LAIAVLVATLKTFSLAASCSRCASTSSPHKVEAL
jgi:hypothetical protein